ncbi:hypothetical protein [Paenibacillus alkalitolerans]|uniref:hypothetical protein n=1 Tax=Paenibacillus alkalitolerans TaxID=2799335 RepID=UPI0018F7913E|nr:hypothetical protein [Paenibacillus alkalitolerans]
MKFSTKARFDYLEQLVNTIDDQKIKKDVLYIIESIKTDIDENYAEISKPVRLHYSESV